MYYREHIPNFNWDLSQSIWAAITDNHRLGGLKTIGIYFSQFWRLGSSWWRHWQTWRLVRASFPAHKWLSSYCVLTQWVGKLCGFSFIRILIPFMRTLPSWPNHFTKASPETLTLAGVWWQQKNAQPRSCELCFIWGPYWGLTLGDSLSGSLRNCSEEVKEEPGYIGVFAGKKTDSWASKDYC